MSLNREEARKRIVRDDGAADDIVWLAPNAPSNYHGTEECTSLQWCDRDPKPRTRSTAQQAGYAPCLKCVLDEEYDPNNRGQQLSAKLRQMTPEEAGLTPTPPRPDRPDSPNEAGD